MLQTVKDYARLFGLFIGATFLFVRLCFGFKLPEPPLIEEVPTPEPPAKRHKRSAEKIQIDPMIMSVKDIIVSGCHTADKWDFETVRDSMLRGATYLRSTLLQANPTIERLPIVLYRYSYGRRICILVYVDFIPSTDGVIPIMQKDQQEKLRCFGRTVTCFLN